MSYDHQLHQKLDTLLSKLEALEKKVNAVAEATQATGRLPEHKKPYHW